MNRAEALKILGLDNSATKEDAKKRFRDLSKTKHPDAGGDEAEYKLISEAYTYLKDPPPENPGFGGSGVHQGVPHGWPFWHGNATPRPRPAPVVSHSQPADIEVNVTLTFKEAVEGCSQEIPIKRRAKCQTCDGMGIKTSVDVCPQCSGTGQCVIQDTDRNGFTATFVHTCPSCKGLGRKFEKCEDCHGKGGIETESTLTAKFRGGLISGNKVIMRGAGHYFHFRGMDAKGNVMANIKVKPEPGMYLKGKDVISDIEISLLESLKGSTRLVKTIDGEHDLKIPVNTRHNEQVKLKGFGVERKGDHVFNIAVRYPDDTLDLIEFLEKE